METLGYPAVGQSLGDPAAVVSHDQSKHHCLCTHTHTRVCVCVGILHKINLGISTSCAALCTKAKYIPMK